MRITMSQLKTLDVTTIHFKNTLEEFLNENKKQLESAKRNNKRNFLLDFRISDGFVLAIPVIIALAIFVSERYQIFHSESLTDLILVYATVWVVASSISLSRWLRMVKMHWLQPDQQYLEDLQSATDISEFYKVAEYVDPYVRELYALSQGKCTLCRIEEEEPDDDGLYISYEGYTRDGETLADVLRITNTRHFEDVIDGIVIIDAIKGTVEVPVHMKYVEIETVVG